MHKIYILERAAKSLKQSKARTILTALAIAVGATTICLALAAGNGGRNYIDKELESRGINIRDISVYAMGGEDGKNAEFCAPEFKILENIAGVESVTGDKDSAAETVNCFYSVKVRAKTENDIAKIMPEIRENLPDFSLLVSSTKEERENLLQSVNVAQWGLIGFGALAVLASIFGIINTQYISVLERTRQIGLMKALGMKRGDVSRLFRYEAAWIGFLGGAIGVLIAWLITFANPLITQFLELKKGTNLLIIDPIQALILIASLILVAVLSGWFPARKATKLDPIDALRTE